jgi:hypothetical protein
MSPYLSKERHEQELSSPHSTAAPANKLFPADDMPIETKQFIPKPGDFMLYTGFTTKPKPFHLVKVIQFVEVADEVEFQWQNNGTKGPNDPTSVTTRVGYAYSPMTTKCRACDTQAGVC